MWQDDDNRPPPADELLRWEASALGEQDPEAEWVLTNYDVWMRNPYYTGPRTEGHPEDHDEPSCVGHKCGPTDPPPEVSPWLRGEVELEHPEDWPDDLPF